MEKINEAYLDASVFAASTLDSGLNGENARDIIDAIQNKLIDGYTSVLTFDESVFVVRKFRGFENSLIAGDDFLNIQHLNFIEVTYEIIALAQELIKKYKIKPRDAIHTACAINNDIKTIISDDSDFDAVKEIERISIKEFKV